MSEEREPLDPNQVSVVREMARNLHESEYEDFHITFAFDQGEDGSINSVDVFFKKEKLG